MLDTHSTQKIVNDLESALNPNLYTPTHSPHDFSDTRKPTEIYSEKTRESAHYSVPASLLEHLAKIQSINKKKLELLKYDLRAATSDSDVKDILGEYLNQDEIDGLVPFLNLGEDQNGSDIDSVQPEKPQPDEIGVDYTSVPFKKIDKSDSILAPKESVVAADDTEILENTISLDEARSDYAALLASFRSKNRDRRNKLRKIFSDLGVGDKPVPEVGREELQRAMDVYNGIKQRNNEAASGDSESTSIIESVEKERRLFLKDVERLSEPTESRILRKSIDRLASGPIPPGLLSDNPSFDEKPPQETVYAGYRFTPTEKVSVLPDQSTVKNPEKSIDGVVRLTKSLPDDVAPVTEAPPIVGVEVAPLGATKEIVEVDTTQESSEFLPPLQFEGKKIHFISRAHGSQDFIVLLDDIEIATGTITEKGPQMTILKNLKSGWFLVDNEFERAFKFANTSIKSGKLKV